MPEISPYRRLQRNIALAPLSPDILQSEFDRRQAQVDRAVGWIFVGRSIMVLLLMAFLQVQLYSLGAVSNWVFPFLGLYLLSQVAIRWHARHGFSVAHWAFLLTDVALLVGLRFFEEVYVVINPDVTVALLAALLVGMYSLRCSPSFSRWGGVLMTAIVIASVSQGNYANGFEGIILVCFLAGLSFVAHASVQTVHHRALHRSLRLVDQTQLAVAKQLNRTQALD